MSEDNGEPYVPEFDNDPETNDVPSEMDDGYTAPDDNWDDHDLDNDEVD